MMLRHIVILSLVLLLSSLLASCATASPPQTSGPIEEITLELNQATTTQNPPTTKPDETAPEDTESNPTPPGDKAPPNTPAIKAPGINRADLEMKIHSLINAERTKHGLSPLAWNDRLSMVARKHSEDMAQRNYFDHTSPEGYGPIERCKQAGLAIRACAENIFLCPQARVNWYVNSVYSYSDYHSQDDIASLVVQGWMDSPGHKKNILNGFWTSQGIGIAISSDNKVYITEDFN